MEPVATQFEDRTFRYTQLERHEDLAIYEQEHKTGGVKRYEVVRIRVMPEHTWPNGDTTPAHEYYPGATAWGRDGFSCFDRKEAQALLATLAARRETAGPEDEA